MKKAAEAAVWIVLENCHNERVALAKEPTENFLEVKYDNKTKSKKVFVKDDVDAVKTGRVGLLPLIPRATKELKTVSTNGDKVTVVVSGFRCREKFYETEFCIIPNWVQPEREVTREKLENSE